MKEFGLREGWRSSRLNGLRQVVSGHRLIDGDFALRENREVFELVNLGLETFAGDAAGVGGTAFGAATGDELFVDDHLAREEHELVGVVRVGLFHERVGRGRVVGEVVVPAFDVGLHEGAGFGGVGGEPGFVGDHHGIGVEPGVPSVEESGHLAARFDDVVRLGDVVALLDQVGVGDEVGDRVVLGNQLKIDAVFLFEIREEGPFGTGHESLAVEVLEAGDGIAVVQHEHGRIVLEHGGDLRDGDVLGDGEERVGAVTLADLRLSGGELLHDEGIGTALNDLHVEAGVFEKSLGLRLIKTAVLGFGDPVELDDDLRRGRGGRGGGGIGCGVRGFFSAGGKGDAGSESGEEAGKAGDCHERDAVSRRR